MINLFLNKTAIKNSRLKCVEFVDSEFNYLYSSSGIKLNAKDSYYIESRDRGRIFDTFSYISCIDDTKQSLDNLSTGCKTLILLNHAKELKLAINITECGTNALNEAFAIQETNIYMPIYRFPSVDTSKLKVKVFKNKETKVEYLDNVLVELSNRES